MSFQLTNLQVFVDLGTDADAEQVDTATRQLLSEILEIDVESAEILKDGYAKVGTKTAEAITIGALIITILPTFIPPFIEFLQSWTLRGENRKIKIRTKIEDREIEVEYNPEIMSELELKKLITSLNSTIEK